MRIIICDDNPHDIHTYSIIVKNVLKQADIDAESFFMKVLKSCCLIWKTAFLKLRC